MITSGYVACKKALHLGDIMKSRHAIGTREEMRRHGRACSQASGYSTKITRSFVTFAGCMQKIKTLLGATRAAQILKVELWAGMSIRVSTRMLKQRLDCAKHSWKHVRSCWWTGSGNYHRNEGCLLACQRRSCHPQVFLSAWPFLRKFTFT